MNFFSANDWHIFSSILLHNTLEELLLGGLGIDLGDAGMTGIARGLSNNESLKVLVLTDCWGVSTTGWAALANALTSHTVLKTLHISGQDALERNGVTTFFANMLANNRSLVHLNLRCGQGGRGIISQAVVVQLSNSLANNKTLESLDLGHVKKIFGVSEVPAMLALSRALCDVSSMNATFRSNHTLNEISMNATAPPSSIRALLRMNSNANEFEVARQKILQHHFNNGGCIQGLVDMDWQILPYALAWAGRDHKGSTLLYRTIKNMPGLVDRDSTKTGGRGSTSTKRYRRSL